MKSDNSAGGCQHKSTAINHPPTESDLIQLLRQSQNNLEQSCELTWFVRGEIGGAKLALVVISSCRAERKGWGTQPEPLFGEPEWLLFLETGDTQKELWSVRSGDVNLISSMTAFDTVEQIPEKEFLPNEPAKVAQTPIDPFAKQEASSLQQSVRNRMGLSESTSSPNNAQQASMGVVLEGNIKDVEISNILQSISICKMTGRLNLNDISQSVELYFADGDLTHARAISGLNDDGQFTGNFAALSVFTWTDGTFKFQHGWQTAQRTVTRRLDGLLLEGAALKDYRAYLIDKNISQSTILCVKFEHQAMSEADFDAALTKGIPNHAGLQKQIFLTLKNAQRLDKIIDDLKAPKTAWIPAIFNLLNLNLIVAVGAKGESQTETAFDSVYELIKTAQKALLQPESGMLSYPLFLVLSRNELARSKETGLSFCIAIIEFDHNGYAPDRNALAHISQAFDSVRRIFDVVSFALPNQCFMLLPQSSLDDAHRVLRQVATQLSTKSSANLTMKAGIVATPEVDTNLIELLNKASIHLKNASAREPLMSSLSTMIIS